MAVLFRNPRNLELVLYRYLVPLHSWGGVLIRRWHGRLGEASRHSCAEKMRSLSRMSVCRSGGQGWSVTPSPGALTRHSVPRADDGARDADATMGHAPTPPRPRSQARLAALWTNAGLRRLYSLVGPTAGTYFAVAQSVLITHILMFPGKQNIPAPHPLHVTFPVPGRGSERLFLLVPVGSIRWAPFQ